MASPAIPIYKPGTYPTTSGSFDAFSGSANFPFDVKYNAPVYDEKAIESLTQRKAATGLRELRRQMQSIQGRAFGSDSPQVRRMALRDALQGYGSGLDRIMSGASESAASEYGKRYGYEVDAAKTQFGANLDVAKMKFQTAYDKWKTDKTLGTQKSIASQNSATQKSIASQNSADERWKIEKMLERDKQKYSPMDNLTLRNAYEANLLREYGKNNEPPYQYGPFDYSMIRLGRA